VGLQTFEFYKSYIPSTLDWVTDKQAQLRLEDQFAWYDPNITHCQHW